MNIQSLPYGVHIGYGVDGRVIIADLDRGSRAPYFGTFQPSMPVAVIGGQPFIAVKQVRTCEECNVSRSRPGKRRCQDCKDRSVMRRRADNLRQNQGQQAQHIPQAVSGNFVGKSTKSNCFLCKVGACGMCS